MRALKLAIDDLDNVHAQFSLAEISSVQHGNLREKAIGQALEALADHYGVDLKTPLTIDSRGEFSIMVKHPDSEELNFCGKFTQEFAEVLNQYGPRCGIYPTAVLDSDSGWCRMNHFSVEKMVTEQCQALNHQKTLKP